MADIGSVVFTALVVPHVLWKPESPLTVWIAAAYFGIDIVQCLMANEIKWDMVLHGLVCHVGYAYTTYTGLHIGLANEALLWEMSTPFLQLRRWRPCPMWDMCFAGSFLAVRTWRGTFWLRRCWQTGRTMWKVVPTMAMGLNYWWTGKIVERLMSP